MKLNIYKYIFLVLSFGFISAQNPCEDPRYLKIKQKSLDEMSDREYEYFMMKERACTESNPLNKSTKPLLKTKFSLSDKVCIKTQYGEMVIKLFPEIAPMHVENFLTHVNNGYYNGTIFHRVIPGFMIQGGDPNTKGDNKAIYGLGGNAGKYFGIGKEDNPKTWTVPSEFSNLKHTKGVLSMARSKNPNSAGSQFFICAGIAPHLNGNYSVFGEVVEGLEIIDKIVNLKRDSRDNPLERVEMEVFICKSDN